MTLMIYIKPFDDEVFENFLKLIKYIQDKEQARGCPITVMVAPDLFQTFEAQKPLQQRYEINKGLKTFDVLTEETKRQIDYIITLGGDGTILWAAKMFNGTFIPPLITFAWGSLGFMCSFKFEDHTDILEKVLD